MYIMHVHVCIYIPKEESQKFEVCPQASETESHPCDSGSQKKMSYPRSLYPIRGQASLSISANETGIILAQKCWGCLLIQRMGYWPVLLNCTITLIDLEKLGNLHKSHKTCTLKSKRH